MPIVGLDVYSVQLSTRYGATYNELHSGKWVFSFKAKRPRFHGLKLATGESLADVEISVSLRTEAKEFVDWAANATADHVEERDRLCGTLHYSPEHESKSFGDYTPPSLFFDLWAPAEVIACLVEFAQQGRHVTAFRLETRGLKYDGFDGRDLRWENTGERNILPVVNVELAIPVLEMVDSDNEPKSPDRAPITPVGADLAPLLREINRGVRWATLLLSGIAGVVIVKALGWG
jgi:hypothetical protein